MKKIKYLVICLLLLLTVGCFKKDKTYEFKSTNTGETIKVTADSSYTLTEGEPVKVSKDDEEIASIIFITKTNYEEVKVLFENKTLIPIDQGTKDNNEYYSYKVSDDYNYVVLINGTNTAAAITTKSEENSKKIVEDLKFSK